MIPRFGRAHVAASIALVALLAGCVGVGQAPSPDPSISRLHVQAKAALERWAAAVASGSPATFVPTGELTGQVGDWEESVGENNKVALMSGMVEAAIDLPSADPPDGELRWQDGSIQAVRLVSAKTALSQLKSDAGTGCSDCMPLRITGARLTSGPIETTRGPAMVPVWEFTVPGSEVRMTRVAIAARTVVEPPPWDPNDAPVGISIELATGKRRRTATYGHVHRNAGRRGQAVRSRLLGRGGRVRDGRGRHRDRAPSCVRRGLFARRCHPHGDRRAGCPARRSGAARGQGGTPRSGRADPLIAGARRS